MRSVARAADVAFLRTGRVIGDGYIDGEVVSPGDRPGYVREKVAEWLEAGAEAVWVVDPRGKTVTVGPHVFEESDTLEGEDVLPGFTLHLRELFG